MPSLHLEHLSVSLGKKNPKRIIHDLSATFLEGQINVIIGASGCGKTTMLRAILGLLPYEGAIYYDDIEISNIGMRERNMAYVNQDISLYPHMSAFNNIAFPLLAAGAPGEEIRERVYAIAEKLHISECLARKPRQLSLGQCQRVAIARALVKRASLYVFDEPFSNLDKALSEPLNAEMKTLFHEMGATVLFVSHDLKEAFQIADRVFMMEEGGNIFASGSVKEIVQNPLPKVQEFVRAI